LHGIGMPQVCAELCIFCCCGAIDSFKAVYGLNFECAYPWVSVVSQRESQGELGGQKIPACFEDKAPEGWQKLMRNFENRGLNVRLL